MSHDCCIENTSGHYLVPIKIPSVSEGPRMQTTRKVTLLLQGKGNGECGGCRCAVRKV